MTVSASVTRALSEIEPEEVVPRLGTSAADSGNHNRAQLGNDARNV